MSARPRGRRGWLAPLIAAALLALTAVALPAQDAVAVARGALAELRAAGEALRTARGASDRVAALTRVIGAYEAGLAALREGLRQAAIREAALRRALDADSEQVSRLLGALETLGTTPESLLLLHPLGPLAAVHAGMLLSDATPQLHEQVAALRDRLADLRILQAVQESALDALQDGLREVQEARTELSAAISNRSELPARLTDDRQAIARLLENADTLAAFAEGLAGIDSTAPLPPAGAGGGVAKGSLPLPVTGRVIRGFGDRDAAGIARPGLVIATAPRALVVTPVAATIRYLGPLLDYGNVMILEPEPDTLVVLAGLGQVYGQVGQVVAAGTPVGLMGGADPTGAEFVAASRDGTGADRSETLYLELRMGNAPVDPAAWFAGTKDDTR